MNDVGLLLLRVGIGGLIFALHGWARLGKLYGYFVLGQQWSFIGLVQRIGFPAPAAFAIASALAESIGALMIIAGVYTRWAAAILAINVGVATWFEVSKGGAGAELPGVYLAALVAIGILGPGRYSVDGRRGGNKPFRARRASK
jgi:putative oxidoreductase